MQPSSGFKSSEFILTIIGAVMGAGLVILGVFKGQDPLVQYGLGLIGANTVGYTVSRSAVKFAHGWSGGPSDDEAPAPAPAAPPATPKV